MMTKNRKTALTSGGEFKSYVCAFNFPLKYNNPFHEIQSVACYRNINHFSTN